MPRRAEEECSTGDTGCIMGLRFLPYLYIVRLMDTNTQDAPRSSHESADSNEPQVVREIRKWQARWKDHDPSVMGKPMPYTKVAASSIPANTIQEILSE